MMASRTQAENGRSQRPNSEQRAPEPSLEQTGSHQGSNEETSLEQLNLDTEQGSLENLATRLTQAMQGEEEELATLAFLQRENDNLRTHLIQRSCGRGGCDHAEDDLHAHWLRQQTRLERMKALHKRICAHRVEIRRLLGMQELRQVDEFTL